MDNTTLVAIIILVGIFGLMAIVLLKWGVDAALKIWGVLGVVLGAIVSFYFTDRVKETEVAQVSEKAADELGEFDQKGSVRTKYGTREQYQTAIWKLKEAGIRVYTDVVFNHRMGADETERVRARRVDMNDRTKAAGEVEEIDAWTRFTFPGRAGKYSSFQWNWTVDTDHPEVREDLLHWGRWYLDATGADGFRFDAVKHVDAKFFLDWLHQLRVDTSRDLFAVGEYWSTSVDALQHFIDSTAGQIALFDAPLHYNFHSASQANADYDLRTIFDNSLVAQQPALAVTLVDNHDSQPLQSLESVVEPWFKPLAYALILLRRDGYPCLFFADYYGAQYTDKGPDGNEHEVVMDSHQFLIDRYLQARHAHGYGEQYEYFEEPNCIGWTRLGDDEHPGGMAVVVSNGEGGSRRMEIGQARRRYVDLTGHCEQVVETGDDGWGDFTCAPRAVSVWVPEAA